MSTPYTYKNWTTEEENKLKNLSGKMNFVEMTKYFPDRTQASLQKKSLKLKLESDYRFHKYDVNQNYWRDLNLIKCYIGGFSCADAYISNNGSSYILQLNPKDISILELIKKETKFTGEIKVYKRKKFKSEELKDVCELSIHRVQQWHIDLEKHFNIINKKSYVVKPPNITNKYFILAFLIGVIDGDGWVIKGRTSKQTVKIGFTSASIDLILWVKNEIDKICSNNYKINKNKNSYYFAISSLKAARIIDYLRQIPVPKLSRKWDKPEVLEYIEKCKLKYPDLFPTINPADFSSLM